MNGTFPKLWPNAWLTACSALALALGGCGGDGGQQASTSPRIDGAVASELADRGDEIARLLDEGDVCGAAHEADQLRAEAQAGVDDGRVPPAFASELVAKADELVNEVNCEAEPPPPPPPPPSEDDDEDRGDRRDRGNGNKKGREEEDD